MAPKLVKVTVIVPYLCQCQPGHMRPPSPADLKVLDHSETEEVAPAAVPAQIANVLADVNAAPALTLKAMMLVWHGFGLAVPSVTIP